jgi:hypothetical protein
MKVFITLGIFISSLMLSAQSMSSTLVQPDSCAYEYSYVFVLDTATHKEVVKAFVIEKNFKTITMTQAMLEESVKADMASVAELQKQINALFASIADKRRYQGELKIKNEELEKRNVERLKELSKITVKSDKK